MVELVDAPDSKSGGLRPLGVRVPLPALGLAPDSGTFSACRRLRTRPSLFIEAYVRGVRQILADEKRLPFVRRT